MLSAARGNGTQGDEVTKKNTFDGFLAVLHRKNPGWTKNAPVSNDTTPCQTLRHLAAYHESTTRQLSTGDFTCQCPLGVRSVDLPTFNNIGLGMFCQR
ncbi:hypothetical protein D9758_015152 [Tetrapyrgos nigripes]|uniref:Uncharacterized protein n=1 Tax=Tetrapyrgos nigripes TaxID=182062 RepID=A0A8H5CRA1_9AGAR|nr:hypothetical protein D9758_015152 [Tetrapyrgos nigripes]